jgi:hypothetical protein
MLIEADAVAAVPIDRCAAEGKIDCRHHATPVDEPIDLREPVRIVDGDQFPLRV